jgi:hypothetical protein
MTEQEQTYAAVVSSEVHKHKTNEEYKCLVVDILNRDWFHYGFELTWMDNKPLPHCLQGLNIRPRMIMANIMPSDDWVKRLVADMFQVSSSFADWMRQFQLLKCPKCGKAIHRNQEAFSELSNPLDVHSERVFYHLRCVE